MKLRTTTLLAGLLITACGAFAQSYPSKPIKAIVPFAAGSATDQIGRAFAQKMSESLGQPIVIENKAGVNGMLGADAVAKAKPTQMTFASASTSQRVSTEMLQSMAGIEMTHVPYKSGPAAMTDLIGGQVNLFTADFAVMLPQVKAGKIRGLAVTSLQRSKAIPELPTVNEALGLKDYELIAYFAMFAPAGTPADVIAKLNKALNQAATDKDIHDKFAAIGFETAPGTPEALAQRNKAETAKWAKAIRDAKIEAE